jgi:hypothetical protein
LAIIQSRLTQVANDNRLVEVERNLFCPPEKKRFGASSLHMKFIFNLKGNIMNSNQYQKDNIPNASSSKGNSQSAGKGSSTQGGTPDQHAEAGRQSNKNSDAGNQSSSAGNRSSGQSGSDNSQSSGKQGGTHEQHVDAGRQSHKNSK